MENRINHQTVTEAFQDADSQAHLAKTLSEPSLCDLLIKWLERTPGLEENGFNFPKRYWEATRRYLVDEEMALNQETDQEKRTVLDAEWRKQKEAFESLLDEKLHNEKLRLKERRLTHKAFMGALMIQLYSSEERFHLPHQLLTVSHKIKQPSTFRKFPYS